MSAPPPPPSGGRLKQRVIANKKAELTDYMGDVKGLIGIYVPPDPARIDPARQAGKISLNPAGGAVNLIFADFVKPGDHVQQTVLNAAARQLVVTTTNSLPEAWRVLTLPHGRQADRENAAEVRPDEPCLTSIGRIRATYSKK